MTQPTPDLNPWDPGYVPTYEVSDLVDILGEVHQAKADYEQKLATTEYDAGYWLSREQGVVTEATGRLEQAMHQIIDRRVRQALADAGITTPDDTKAEDR